MTLREPETFGAHLSGRAVGTVLGMSDFELLADRAAVYDTVIAYATALDSRDWDGLRGVLTDDVVWAYPARGLELHGPDAVVDLVRGSLSHLDGTQHVNSNHMFRIDGDEAGHSCYFLAHHVRSAHPAGPLFVGAGRYDDRLRRTPAGWRLSRRTLTSTWTSGDPALLRP